MSYPADLMFQVVAAVEEYPEFLPWVVALRLLSREAAGDNGEILIAEMAVGYGALRERYTSRVTLDRTALTVDVVEIKGPFKQLENHWRFTPVHLKKWARGMRSDIFYRLRIRQPAFIGGGGRRLRQGRAQNGRRF